MTQEPSGEIPCLDSEQIRALVLGEIAPERITQFEKHLASCGLCRERLEKESGDPSWMEKVRVSLIQPIGANEENNASPASTTPPDPVLSLLDSSTHPDALGKIKDYEILGVLGRGGMGTVLRAFDPGLNRFVALKILSPHLAANATARKRFLREARAAAAIAHENVIAIHGVSEFKGIPYLVMPLIRGDSLQKRMRENGSLELEEVLRIGLQTASGLAAAHSQGLIHRDVKPANILLGPGTERVTLTDFGLARTVDEVDLTQTGMLAGTPRYMSPEQTRGENLDTRSDLFSLGTVLFEMVTGHAPFRGQTTFTLMKSITESQHKPVRDLRPDCPEWLERIIHRLLAKNPIDRFASAKDVQRLLSQGLAHLRSPKTEMAPTTAGFVLPTKDTIASPEKSLASPASSNPQSNKIASILLSLTPLHWGVGVLFILVISSIGIPIILESSPTERLAIIAVLLSPINMGIILYAAYRIYLAMFGKSRTTDSPVEVAPAHSANSKSNFANALSPTGSLFASYALAVYLVTFLASTILILNLINSLPVYQTTLILFFALLIISVFSFLYFKYYSNANTPLWKNLLPTPIIISIISIPFLMISTLEEKQFEIGRSRDAYIATLESRVINLGQEHPDRQPITTAQSMIRKSGGQLGDPIRVWQLLIGGATILGIVGLVLVLRKNTTKRIMVYWAGSLGGVVLVFLILTEWAHQAAIAEMALITNQTFPRENAVLPNYYMSKEAIPSPEPVIRGGSLIAPLIPRAPMRDPNRSSLQPFPGLPDPNTPPISSYRPAKPFTIKSLGLLPDPENASYFGYEITVPPEQLIAITIYEETPEAKRVRYMGSGPRRDSPAYGLIHNPTKEPKRAIWSVSGGKSGRIKLDTYSWRLNWADQTESDVRSWRNSDDLRESFLGNLDFQFPPTIVPSDVSTEIRLEMVAQDARPGILKSLGGNARRYIQFRSVPMPMETLQIKPSILNALREFPRSMGLQPAATPPAAMAPGNVPSELFTKPILGMNPKYWEWYSGFETPGNESRIQLTVYSRNNIKVLGRVGDLDQAVKTMSAAGFLTESNIVLKHDPLLIDKSQLNQMAENLLAKGYKNVKVEELPKSQEGSGEILLPYPPGRGEDFLKILDPKLQVWNNQQKEKFPKDPVGTLVPLGQTGLLEAKGSYRFLKMLITVLDKANESKPGEPLSDLLFPQSELPNNPPLQLPELSRSSAPDINPPNSTPNPKETPAKESPSKEPVPKDTALKEPLKKNAPLENSPKSENSPKKDSPAKETPASREALKK